MQAEDFYQLLTREVDENIMGLPRQAYQSLRSYYRTLTKNTNMRSFYRHNWTQRVGPMVSMLKVIPEGANTARVLDAGCGVGSESIFWNLISPDIEVVGVDISAERLLTAQARKKAYEKFLGKDLRIRFLDDDVFDVLKHERFTAVWVMEAISHIDPAETFLNVVYDRLEPGGSLIISDSHRFNPIVAWELYRLRQRGITERTTKITAKGKSISYAQERLFTVNALSHKLKQASFDSVQARFHVFFPPFLAKIQWLFHLGLLGESLLRRLPGIRHLGGIFTITATKRH